MAWALRDAPGVPSQAAMTLMGLANHADHEGKGSHPAQKTLTRYTRKCDRQVRRDLTELERAGLIHKGDQRLVAHYPADRRPIVWDLALERRQTEPADDETTATPGRLRPPGRARPDADDRADVHDRPDTGDESAGHNGRTQASGRTCAPQRPDVDVLQTVHKEKKTSSSSPSRKRSGRDKEQTSTTDPETADRTESARQIVEWWRDQLDPKPAGGSKAYFAARREIEKLLAVGWEPEQVAAAARAIGSPLTVPRMELELHRARRAQPPDAARSPTATAAPRPAWCGVCNERTRLVEDDEAPYRCPRCHPTTRNEATP